MLLPDVVLNTIETSPIVFVAVAVIVQRYQLLPTEVILEEVTPAPLDTTIPLIKSKPVKLPNEPNVASPAAEI